MAQQGAGEGRIAAGAVQRHVSGAGGKGDDGAFAALILQFQFRKTGTDTGRTRGIHGPGQRACQRVVAAGIEKHHPHLHVIGHLPQHEVGGDGFKVQRRFVVEFRIHGDEIIGAAHLHAVSGIEQQRHIGAARFLRELCHRPAHGVIVEVIACHHLESEVLQLGRHGARIIGRIGKRDGVDIGPVAHDQRHTFGQSRADAGQNQEKTGERARKHLQDLSQGSETGSSSGFLRKFCHGWQQARKRQALNTGFLVWPVPPASDRIQRMAGPQPVLELPPKDSEESREIKTKKDAEASFISSLTKRRVVRPRGIEPLFSP